MRTRRKRGRKQEAAQGGGQPNSLFGEILDWMLAPLLFLWPISIIVTHNVADNIANQPYDQALAENVRALAGLVKIVEHDEVHVDFPAPPRILFRADQDDAVYYQVADQRGAIVSGDIEIPWVSPPSKPPADQILFRDEVIHGEEARVAYLFLAEPERGAVLVQVAETLHKRRELAARVVTGVLLPQFAIIPLAVVLVWSLALSRPSTDTTTARSSASGRAPNASSRPVA